MSLKEASKGLKLTSTRLRITNSSPHRAPRLSNQSLYQELMLSPYFHVIRLWASFIPGLRHVHQILVDFTPWIRLDLRVLVSLFTRSNSRNRILDNFLSQMRSPYRSFPLSPEAETFRRICYRANIIKVKSSWALNQQMRYEGKGVAQVAFTNLTLS